MIYYSAQTSIPLVGLLFIEGASINAIALDSFYQALTGFEDSKCDASTATCTLNGMSERQGNVPRSSKLFEQ
jgi:hypothetical protein